MTAMVMCASAHAFTPLTPVPSASSSPAPARAPVVDMGLRTFVRNRFSRKESIESTPPVSGSPEAAQDDESGVPAKRAVRFETDTARVRDVRLIRRRRSRVPMSSGSALRSGDVVLLRSGDGWLNCDGFFGGRPLLVPANASGGFPDEELDGACFVLVRASNSPARLHQQPQAADREPIHPRECVSLLHVASGRLLAGSEQLGVFLEPVAAAGGGGGGGQSLSTSSVITWELSRALGSLGSAPLQSREALHIRTAQDGLSLGLETASAAAAIGAEGLSSQERRASGTPVATMTSAEGERAEAEAAEAAGAAESPFGRGTARMAGGRRAALTGVTVRGSRMGGGVDGGEVRWRVVRYAEVSVTGLMLGDVVTLHTPHTAVTAAAALAAYAPALPAASASASPASTPPAVTSAVSGGDGDGVRMLTGPASIGGGGRGGVKGGEGGGALLMHAETAWQLVAGAT